MRKNKKILLLGASGHIGKYFWKALKRQTVVATYHQHAFSGGISFDMRINNLHTAVPQLDQFTHAIVLLGDTNTERCAKDIERSNKINIDSLKKIIDTLIEYNIIVIFASSEFVFDGRKGMRKETDTPHPIMVYAKQKYFMEQYIIEHTHTYIIVRFGKVYGTEPGDGTLFTSWIEQLRAGQPIVVATDQKFNAICADDLVTATLFLINKGVYGIYHVAGPIGLYRKDLFDLLLQKLQGIIASTSQVSFCSIDDFHLIEKRPHNVTLSINKLVRTTGYTPRSPREVIGVILQKYNL